LKIYGTSILLIVVRLYIFYYLCSTSETYIFIAKEPVFGKVLPGDVWDWSIVLFKRPFVVGRYMLEFLGKVIGVGRRWV